MGDLLPERAQAKAEEHGVPSWGTGEDVLSNPDVDLVVNLTIPAVHVEVSKAAVAAGKHVWTEKPLGLDRESTRELLAQAEAAGVRIGSPPTRSSARASRPPSAPSARASSARRCFVQTSFQTQGPDLCIPSRRSCSHRVRAAAGHGAVLLLGAGELARSGRGRHGARIALADDPSDPHRCAGGRDLPRRGTLDRPGADLVRRWPARHPPASASTRRWSDTASSRSTALRARSCCPTRTPSPDASRT